MDWIKLLLLSPLFFLLILAIYYFLDERTAIAINNLWKSDRIFSLLSSNMPDLLFLFVCLITCSAWLAYFFLARRGVRNIHIQFYQLIAITVPISFMAKSLLKIMVGRIETRYWLLTNIQKNFTGFTA